MPKVQFDEIKCKTILHKLDTDYLPYQYDVNIYRGCQHSCVYCFARYTHEYLGYTNATDFDQIIKVKINAPAVLDNELLSRLGRRLKGSSFGRGLSPTKTTLINLGGVSDSYQPIEKKYQLARKCLEILIKHKIPVVISTKSDLILRDLDLLQKLAEVSRCSIGISLISLDSKLLRIMEPFASSVERRLNTLKKLSESKTDNMKIGLHLMPIIPFITDDDKNLNDLIKLCAEYKLDYIVCDILNLRSCSRKRFLPFIKSNFPNLLSKFLNLYKTPYIPKEYSDEIYSKIRLFKLHYGIEDRWEDEISIEPCNNEVQMELIF